jgi:hypothetical protein
VSPIGTRDTGLERAKSSCRRYGCATQSRRRGSRNGLASGTAADGAKWINRRRMWVRVMRLDWGRTDRSRWQRGVDSERAKSFIETHNHDTNGGPLDCNDNAIHCLPVCTIRQLCTLPIILLCSRDTRRAAIVDAILCRPVPRVRSHVKLCIYRACGAPESPFFCLLVEVPPCLSRDSVSMPPLCNQTDIFLSARGARSCLVRHVAHTLSHHEHCQESLHLIELKLADSS